ncbi:thiamine pyrophosphate-binding protein [soil metagenome]
MDSESQRTWRSAVIDALKANDIELVCHVADSVLAPIIQELEADPAFSVITLTREEEGVGALTGAYLGGRRGALLLQASGFGNILNALGSLAIPYQIPFPIILSARGGYLEHNVVQVAWGKAVPETAEALGMQYFPMTDEAEVPFIARQGIHHAFISRRPTVIGIETQLSGGKRGS